MRRPLADAGEHSAGGAAEEQAVALRQPTADLDRLFLGNRQEVVNARRLEYLRKAAGAEPRDMARTARQAECHRADSIDGNDFGLRMMFGEIVLAAHQRAGGTRADEQVIHVRKFARDGPGSRLIVGEGVGRILVLVEPDVIGVVSDQLFDQANPRIQVTAVLVTLIDHEQLRAKGVNQLAVRRGNIRVDYANELVTLGGANHGQRNAQIPR